MVSGHHVFSLNWALNFIFLVNDYLFTSPPNIQDSNFFKINKETFKKILFPVKICENTGRVTVAIQ